MEQQQTSKYLGYSGGKGYVWVAAIIIIAVLFIGLYFSKYFVADYANWNVANPDADKIIWQVEQQKHPDMSE